MDCIFTKLTTNISLNSLMHYKHNCLLLTITSTYNIDIHYFTTYILVKSKLLKWRLDPRSEIPSFQYILRSTRIVHSTGLDHNFIMNLSKWVDKGLSLKNQTIIMFLFVNRRYFWIESDYWGFIGTIRLDMTEWQRLRPRLETWEDCKIELDTQ